MSNLIGDVARARMYRGDQTTTRDHTPADGFDQAFQGAVAHGGAHQEATGTGMSGEAPAAMPQRRPAGTAREQAPAGADAEQTGTENVDNSTATPADAEPVAAPGNTTRAAQSAFALLTERGAWRQALGRTAGLVDGDPKATADALMAEAAQPSTETSGDAAQPSVEPDRSVASAMAAVAAGLASAGSAVRNLVAPTTPAMPAGVADTSVSAVSGETPMNAASTTSQTGTATFASPTAPALTATPEAMSAAEQATDPAAGTQAGITTAEPATVTPGTLAPNANIAGTTMVSSADLVAGATTPAATPVDAPANGTGVAGPAAPVAAEAAATSGMGVPSRADGTSPAPTSPAHQGQADAVAGGTSTQQQGVAPSGVPLRATDGAGQADSTNEPVAVPVAAPQVGMPAAPTAQPGDPVDVVTGRPAALAIPATADAAVSDASSTQGSGTAAQTTASSSGAAPMATAGATVPSAVPTGAESGAVTREADIPETGDAAATGLAPEARGVGNEPAADARSTGRLVESTYAGTHRTAEAPAASAPAAESRVEEAPRENAPEQPRDVAGPRTSATFESAATTGGGTDGDPQSQSQQQSQQSAAPTTRTDVVGDRGFTAPSSMPIGSSSSTSASGSAGAPAQPPHMQILRGVGPLLDGGDGVRQITLQLAPAHLGRVSVTLEMRGGEVNIVMQAADGTARDVLRSGLDELRGQLSDMGLRPGSVDVNSGGHADGGQATWEDVAAQAEAARRAALRNGSGFSMEPGPTTPDTSAPSL